MVRKQLYIRADQDRLLKQRARALGVSEAELVRSALDGLLAGHVSTDDEWAAFLSEADDIAAGTSSGGWRFDRDEIYERS